MSTGASCSTMALGLVDDMDAHICMSCNISLIGLASYIEHKTLQCPAKQKQNNAELLETPDRSSSALEVLNALGSISMPDGSSDALGSLNITESIGTTERSPGAYGLLNTSLSQIDVVDPNSIFSQVTSLSSQDTSLITQSSGLLSAPNQNMSLENQSQAELSTVNVNKEFWSSLDLKSKSGSSEDKGSTIEGSLPIPSFSDNQLASNTQGETSDFSDKITKICETIQQYVSDSDDTEEYTPDHEDDLGDDLGDDLPSSQYTGGKWKPGSKPTSKIKSKRKFNSIGGKWKPGMADKNMARCQQTGQMLLTPRSRKLTSKMAELKNEDTDTDTENENEGPVTCDSCKETFYSPEHIAEHLLTLKHTESAKRDKDHYEAMIFTCHKFAVLLSKYICKCCRFYCNRQNDYLNHCRSRGHTRKTENKLRHGKVLCTLCNLKFNTNEEYISHVMSTRKHSADSSLPPDDLLCDYPGQLVFTMIKVKNSFACLECDKKYTSKASYRKHMDKHSKNKFYCGICRKEFLDHYSLSRHKMGMLHKKKETLHNLRLATRPPENGYDMPRKPKKTFMCSECHKGFKNKATLKFHIQKFHGMFDEKDTSKQAYCHTCNLTFAGMMALQKHERGGLHRRKSGQAKTTSNTQTHFEVLHYASDKMKECYKCKHCAYITEEYKQLRPHFLEQHADKGYCCLTCDLVFKDESLLYAHTLTKTHLSKESMKDYGKETYNCLQCNKKFYDNAEYQVHSMMHGAIKLQKEYVNNPPESLMKYRDFIMTAKKKAKFTCPECDKVYSKGHLIPHLCSHAGNVKLFTCEVCNVPFNDITSVMRHAKMVHFCCGKYLCDTCGRAFSRKQILQHHIVTTHSSPADAQFRCEYCGKGFFSRRQVHHHKKQVHEKVFACTWPKCRFKAGHQSSLKLHVRNHTNDKPYKCDKCAYSCTLNQKLKRHMRVHTGERLLQYKCQYCAYQGKQSGNIIRHMRIHTGAKPYHCPHCNYKCNVIENLRKHIKTAKAHEGKMVYNCKKCTFNTDLAKDYADHMAVEHDDGDIDHSVLSAHAGLYFPEEDVRIPEEGALIIPVKEDKYKHVRQRKNTMKESSGNENYLKPNMQTFIYFDDSEQIVVERIEETVSTGP